MKTQQWVLCRQAQEYQMVIPTQYDNLPGWAECIHRFIWIVKQTTTMYIEPVRAIVEPTHLVSENAT